MGNRYKEVFLTYLRRPFSSWQTVATMVAGVLLIGLSCVPGRSSISPWMLGSFFLVPSLWVQFIEQMAGWQRVVTPNYAVPHVSAFTILSAAFVFAIPLPVAMAHHQSYLAAISIVTLFFGTIGISLALASIILLAVFPLGVLLIFSGSSGTRMMMASALSGGDHNLTWFLLGTGATLSIAALFRIACLKPEGLGRSAPIESFLFGWWLRRGRSKAPVPTGPLPRIAATMRGRARWRRSGFFRSRSLLPMLAFILVPIWLLCSVQHPHTIQVIVGAQFLLPCLAVLPAIIRGGGTTAVRFQMLETESLRPAARSNFIKGFALSFFVATFKAFAISSAVFLVAIYLAGGGLAGTLLLVPFVFSIMLAQPLVFALVWFLTSCRRAPLLMVAAGAPLIGIGPVLFPDANYQGFLIGGVVCMLIGLILIPLVYRRWMNLELG